jgi:hypothetical protein
VDDVLVAVTIGFFVGMFVTSVWGAVRVPDDARFPIRFGGASGFQTYIGKWGALVLWPLLGFIVTFGVTLTQDAEAEEGGTTGLALIGAITMAILFLAQVASVRRQARS